MAKQIGYAVVGAGPFVERALLPAFARAGGETRLAAIVSADRTRAHALAREHRATGSHYDEFRQALQREDVQAVYLALPNSLHCDYAVEAARADAHIVCERPMAVMADECRRMLRTCQTNRVKLMGRLPRASAPRVQEAARAGAARRHRRAQDIQQRRDDPGAGSRRRPAAAPPRRRHRVRPRRAGDLRRAHRVRRGARAGHGHDRPDDPALRRRRRREHRRPHPPPRRPARAPAHVVRRGTDVGAHGVRGRGLDPPHRGLRGAGRLRARGRARRPSAATATATTVGSSSWTAASASPVAPA